MVNREPRITPIRKPAMFANERQGNNVANIRPPTIATTRKTARKTDGAIGIPAADVSRKNVAAEICSTIRFFLDFPLAVRGGPVLRVLSQMTPVSSLIGADKNYIHLSIEKKGH